ncbi:hypothetical protein GCM10023200_47480 [Actinomycetospora chlora]|uniref:Uncharacterized protein n=1 Tax=Actinomycetospora chlora TaxID=663608 RepID=A0ABP9C6L8_9PSEU
MGTAEPDLLPGYAEWLARITATVDAVSYTCGVRLGDRAAGDAVAARVAVGLVSRPTVFRHWGLPYSGRIAKLAEDAIADVRAGRLVGGSTWGSFRQALVTVPPDHQSTLVLACVEGYDADQLAMTWRCDVATARDRRTRTLTHMKELAAAHGAAGDVGPEEGWGP